MKPSLTLWLYRQLVRLLPATVREHDGTEICAAFASQLRDARGRRARAAVAMRAFRRFPAVLAMEWRDARRYTQTWQRRGNGMGGVVRMVKQAARSVLRSPAFSLSVIVLVGLGVGTASAIFAVVDHVLLRDLPYPSAERLILVRNGAHSGPAYREFATMRSVEAWSAALWNEGNLTGEREPLRVASAAVTPGFFRDVWCAAVHGAVAGGG